MLASHSVTMTRLSTFCFVLTNSLLLLYLQLMCTADATHYFCPGNQILRVAAWSCVDVVARNGRHTLPHEESERCPTDNPRPMFHMKQPLPCYRVSRWALISYNGIHTVCNYEVNGTDQCVEVMTHCSNNVQV